MKLNKHLILTFMFVALIPVLAACDLFQEEEVAENNPVILTDDSIVSATGILTPEHSAYLSIAGAGRVDEIFIEKGQSVSEGQKLIQLSALAQTEAILAAAELEHEAAQQALDDLFENTNLVRARTWIALLDAKTTYNAAEAAWEDLDTDELEDDIDEAQEEVLDSEDELEEAQERFESYAELDENSGIRNRYEDELEEAQKEYNEKVRARDELIIEMQEAEAIWSSAKAALEIAQGDYDATSSGPDPDMLALAEARVKNAEAQINAALEQINNLTLSAPMSGVIADLLIREGEWAVPGQPVIVLADLSSLRIETTDLNEIDVMKIEVGDKAEVTFDAIPDHIFQGTVTEISPKASEGIGVNYTVVIEMSEIPENARWGMTVFVDIDTNQ